MPEVDEADRAEAGPEELEDLEVRDADVTGGGVNGAGGSADPTGNEMQ